MGIFIKKKTTHSYPLYFSVALRAAIREAQENHMDRVIAANKEIFKSIKENQMTKEEKLADLERRQREIADEIAELRKPEAEFVPGRFYKSETGVVLCINKAIDVPHEYFNGVIINDHEGKRIATTRYWAKKHFHEVRPTGWEAV